MHHAFPIALALGLLTLAACDRPDRITAQDRMELNCLASKVVVELTDQVRTGLEAGQDANDLAPLQQKLTAEGLLSAKYLFPSKHMHQAYYEFDVARRAKAVQTALTSSDASAPAHAVMVETLRLGQSCIIARLPQ